MSKKYFEDVKEQLVKIITSSEDMETALKEICKIIHSSYHNGIKAGQMQKAEASNPFFQSKDKAHD